jgi:hypothetical protein
LASYIAIPSQLLVCVQWTFIELHSDHQPIARLP